MAILIKSNGTAEATTPATTTTATSTDTTAKTTSAAATTETNADKTNASKASTPATTTPEAATAGTDAASTTNTNTGTDFSKISTTYDGKYDEQLADLYNQITQRKQFSYTPEDDLLYQQYVDQYTKGGRLAMQDTMGQAAALTGGYGNTYAQRVGQQTYDEYMTGLADKQLQLEETAYQRYQDEGNQMLQNYSLLNNLADDDYAKWQDTYDRAMSEAALRANSGDFDPYKQLYGDEAGTRMQQSYAAQVLMPLYKQGYMDAETYAEIAGTLPVGYKKGGSGSGGYDDSIWWGNGGGSNDQTLKEWAQGEVNSGRSPEEVNNEIVHMVDAGEASVGEARDALVRAQY